MNVSRLVGLFVVLLLVIGHYPTQAQDREQVGFVDEFRLGTASPNDPGPEGLSRLANILRQFDVEPVTVDLFQPVPPDIDVLFMVRVQSRLTLRDSVYLYDFLQRGGRLLLAFDPDEYAGVRMDFDRSPLSTILAVDYGVTFREALLAESWFSALSLQDTDFATAQTVVWPEDWLGHPVITDLQRYDLPVQMWAGRNLMLEPFGVHSFGTALLVTDSAFGETSTGIFDDEDPAPLVYDIAGDYHSSLVVSGVGVNNATGASVVLVGDSEMLQNGRGLALHPEANTPLYPGNFLFAERIAAWMLQVPPAFYPELPPGLTWLAVDGSPADWEQAVGSDSAPTEGELPVQAVTNDHYLYMRVDAGADAEQLTFTLRNTAQDETVPLTAVPGVVRHAAAPIPDADAAFGEWVEVRVPLRLVPLPLRVIDLCVETPTEQQCRAGFVRPVALPTRDPAPVRLTAGPLAVVRSSVPVNLRAAPSTNAAILRSLTDGTQLAVVGRSPEGDWLSVRTAGYEGWIADFIVRLNTPISQLDVITPAE